VPGFRTTDDLKTTLVMLLAGGQGERLYPLTRDRAKPAVPFGGIYRIIDFTLSNCINSGLRRINVLTQYKSYSLQRHLQFGWNIFRPELDEYINVVPPQQRASHQWYLGTADAIFQNIDLLEHERPRTVLVVSGDHVYKMDYRPMLEYHLAHEAELTMACALMPVERAAHQLGVAVTDSEGRVVEFHEKPEHPPELPDRPGYCLCSMGVYIFDTRALVIEVTADAKTDSIHDFGKNVIPSMIAKQANIRAYPFSQDQANIEPYWRDIGTIDAYWESNYDLVQPLPLFNLYDHEWPIRTHHVQAPPAKTVFNEVPNGRRGMACIISGATVEESILSPNVFVHTGADICKCVVLDDVEVGRGARLNRAIIDKTVSIPPGAVIGYDLARDRRRFTVSENGVVVVPRGIPIEV